MENTIDLTTLLNALIALMAAIVTTFVIPWLKSKTTENQRREMLEWAKIGVKAAEQLYSGSGRGLEKKIFVEKFLKEKGFSVDEKEVKLAVEAAVNDITGKSKKNSKSEDEEEEVI